MIEVHLQRMADKTTDMDVVIERFPFVIGRRSDCDHRLNDAGISRRHCCFHLKGEEIWIQDLESTNGTYVNGKRIRVPQVLHEADVITLEYYSFQFSFASVTQ